MLKSTMQKNIEELSAKLYIYSTKHRFKKEKSSFDKGYLNANTWIDNLCNTYLQKDKQIEVDFEAMMAKLSTWLESRGESPYKEGMNKALNDVGY